MHQPNKDLAHLVKLFESGNVVPIIDRTYPLSETGVALRRLGDGAALGKVVVSIV
jgi:NADPH:quinone reductase-like Zn-dependent oxidoreductase